MAALHEKYRKLDPRQHVLTRPGMYIGSVDEDVCMTWTYDIGTSTFQKKEIRYVPGLYKIFDEILVNALDHVTRLKAMKEKDASITTVKNIKIRIDKVSGEIEVMNDGEGIDIEQHPEHHVWIPELIFGNMLTSANYDDNEEKIIGGQNGIGAKACNIFSSRFYLETVDSKRKKIYTQEF
jgi:DNA topoisomerase II